MQEPQSKKFKRSHCVICGGSADCNEENEVLSTVLITQFIAPWRKENIAPLKVFDFCTRCKEVIEELRQLQIGLDFILKNIKQKEMEIKRRILVNEYKSYSEEVKAFQRIATKEFCPKVQMSRNNILSNKSSKRVNNKSGVNVLGSHLNTSSTSGIAFPRNKELISKINSEESYPTRTITSYSRSQENSALKSLLTDESQTSQEKRPADDQTLFSYSPLWYTNTALFLESTKSENNRDSSSGTKVAQLKSQADPYSELTLSQLLTPLLKQKPENNTSLSTKSSVESKTDNYSNLTLLELLKTPVNGRINNEDSKIRSEVISVPPQHLLHFEEESAVEFEPWHETPNDDIEFNSNDDFIANDEESDVGEPIDPIITDNSNTSSVLSGKTTVNNSTSASEKPPLSYVDLCVLAIMTSKELRLLIHQIHDFILDNFHYFRSGPIRSWKNNVRCAITNICFTKVSFNKGRNQFMYTIKPCQVSFKVLKTLHSKLNDISLAAHMSYPERRTTFQNDLLKDIPEIPDSMTMETETVENISNDGNEDDSVDSYNMDPDEHEIKVEYLTLPIREDDYIPYSANINTPQVDSALNEFDESQLSKENRIYTIKVLQNQAMQNIALLPHRNSNSISRLLLTDQELCVLAILNTKNMRVKLDDVFSFIMENFKNIKQSYKRILKTVLTPSNFDLITPHKTDDPNPTLDNEDGQQDSQVYTVAKHQVSDSVRQTLSATLCTVENLSTMIFPGRVVGFIQNVMSNIVPSDTSEPSMIS